MAFDSQLFLTGSATNPSQTISANGNGTGVDVGANRIALAELRIAGTVTGTSPTLDIKLQEADTQGGSYSDIPGAAFPQRTSSDAAFDPSQYSNVPRRLVFKTSKRWVRASWTVGGTSPVFNGVSVMLLDPVGMAVG